MPKKESEMLNKTNNIIELMVGLDTSKLTAKLKAIAKHAEALTEELKNIDNPNSCPRCGGVVTEITFTRADNIYKETQCENKACKHIHIEKSAKQSTARETYHVVTGDINKSNYIRQCLIREYNVPRSDIYYTDEKNFDGFNAAYMTIVLGDDYRLNGAYKNGAVGFYISRGARVVQFDPVKEELVRQSVGD